MSEFCDFVEDAYTNVSASSGKECAKLCRKDKGCTHFTYIKDNGKLQKCLSHFQYNHINLFCLSITIQKIFENI